MTSIGQDQGVQPPGRPGCWVQRFQVKEECRIAKDGGGTHCRNEVVDRRRFLSEVADVTMVAPNTEPNWPSSKKMSSARDLASNREWEVWVP